MVRSADPKLRELARELGVETRGNCAKNLRTFALDRVRAWTSDLPVGSTSRLLELVAGLLSLKILFIREDADVVGIASQFQDCWPNLENQLRAEFLEGDTLGFLLSHPSPERGAHRYHAFIDARGENAYRAYFTAWHEVAHRLLQPEQLSFKGLRRVSVPTTEPKDPVEALVDEVAGELAFYAPFAAPELRRELDDVGHLTLDGISRIRDAVAPDGSFSAAAHALVRLSRRAMAFVVADVQLKPTEARRLDSPQLALLDAAAPPTPKLRAKSVFPNEPAKSEGFRIFRHMRVPPESLITAVYEGRIEGSAEREEDQRLWESGGEHLNALPLHVEASKFGDVVYALLTCKGRS